MRAVGTEPIYKPVKLNNKLEIAKESTVAAHYENDSQLQGTVTEYFDFMLIVSSECVLRKTNV